jgi:type II secretory pathway component PulJ
MNLDPATLAIGAAVGGGVGTLAALFVFGLIARFAWRLWKDFDQQRTDRMNVLADENADLRRRVAALEARLGTVTPATASTAGEHT